MRDTNQFGTQKQQVKFLILCPTRELSLQVFKEINSLKLKKDDFNVVAVYGGAGIEQQIRDINGGVDIIVATPGRLMDLIERKVINFSELKATCIDEADQMLEKGFKLDI
jgi:ATP-dependent RNA helicase DeaD